ncbi:hypothetical protein BKH41_09355 [Helicobacter sp. 12S02232-10]|uniref:hypothetical protein n=1 Tax=Helicobacter sp. 12S02232-10 TaxID=1476197 RepID=UPI000BA74D25|nr:hypothetical protein [Helicobacter sp. 12S02232-10]PAF46304.1 hypothetical protein BKH41_09355 [Helicobacter sp. 12S02232-10]
MNDLNAKNTHRVKTRFNLPLIKGKNADYSPKWFFECEGRIYLKLGLAEATKKDFKYPFIDYRA